MITGPYPQGVRPTYRDLPLDLLIASKGSDEPSKSYNLSDKLKNGMSAVSEAESSKSGPLSIPYNQTHNTNSTVTASLLNQSENRDPIYSNYSHINMEDISVNQKRPYDNQSTPECGKIDENIFNQVPNDGQELDSLTLDSISLYSMDAPETKSTEKLTIHDKWPEQARNNAQVRRSASATGSQSTIFSTRQDKKRLIKLSKSKYRASGSNLSRTKAIRFREGSWYYRLKVRMRKFAKKLKALRFNKFTVTSKRTASKKRYKSRGKTLKRKYRKNPQNAAVKRLTSKEISVPYSNPQLGRGEIEKVETLDARLKHQAGAMIEHNNIVNNNKQNQISEYIDEQQDSYINSMNTKTKSSSINYGNNSFDRNEFKHTYNSGSDIEEIPPTPPPHLEHNNFSTVEGEKANDVIGAWKRYLSHVISQRIQLRQEIVFFQTLAARQKVKFIADDGISKEAEDYNDNSDSLSASESGSIQGNSINETETLSGSDIAIESDIVDSPTEEFNKTYSRRSMLGEMLDYDSSDNELLSSSVYSNSSRDSTVRYENFIRSASSTANSDIGIGKRYGTVLRRNTTISRKRTEQKPESRLARSMKRSQGIQVGLNEVK